ncbi:MAG: SCO family protein [Bryobacterales bacterium]|nr:SCO family protein [Bryobacterales bacterium]
MTVLTVACARRYRMDGLVLRVDLARNRALISHQAVPGYMPAMAMPFRVQNPRELQGVAPGARVTFDLYVGKSESYIKHIRIRDARRDGATDFQFPTAPEQLSVGQAVPDFALTDQTGKPVRLGDFRGRVVALNFLYTRCPLPEVCPRLAAAFLSLQRRFRDRIPRDLVLLSVTLDPQYDTPPVLSAYASSIGARWPFLTGSPDRIRETARQFGLIHWAEEGVIVHTSATAVIDRLGNLAALVEGSSFRLEQLLDLIGESLGQ